jgi:mannosyltransferase OCH1-like enzyme
MPPRRATAVRSISKMRRGTIIFLIINLLVIGFLLNAFSTLIGLLFEDGSADAIHRAEIPAPGSDLIDNRTQLIPKIIHQTYINSSIPIQWKAGQQSCIDLHEDYEYKVRFPSFSRPLSSEV